MNYGDFLKFVRYNRTNNTEDTAGQVLNELINYSNVIDGSSPYFYLDSHNNVRIANAVDNFQITELMQKGHRKLIENLNGEDSDYWMERTVNALGRNKKVSFENDWALGSDSVKKFKEWYDSGKPELAPEAVNKVISSKARMPNSTDTAEDFYFNNKRFKRTETGEKGSTITKFYNDDGDIIRTTYKNANGELKTVDAEGNFIRKTINTKTNGFNIEYGQKNEKGKEIINEIRQVDKNGKVSPRKEKIGKDSIDKLNKLSQEIEKNNRAYNSHSDNDDVKSVYKEKLDKAIDEYLELESQVKESFPDYKRGREDAIIQQHRPQTDTKQTVNDTSQQYDTKQEPKTEQTKPETKQESGPKMEIEDDGSTKVRTDSNGNEMYTFEDLRREAEERRRQAQEKNGSETETIDSYVGDPNNPYYEGNTNLQEEAEKRSESKLEEALNTEPPGKDEIIYENGDRVITGRDPFEQTIEELDEDDILIEQQLNSRDNLQREHSTKQQEPEVAPEENIDSDTFDFDFDGDTSDFPESDSNDLEQRKKQVTEDADSLENEFEQIFKDLHDGKITEDEASRLIDEASDRHANNLDNAKEVGNESKKKLERYEEDSAKQDVKEPESNGRPTTQDVIENAKEAREVNQEKPQYNQESKPQYNQQHPTENLNKEKKPQTTEEVIENAKKQRRKAQRKKSKTKPQYNQQEPYKEPPQVQPKSKPKPQTKPEPPKFEDTTIDLVNKNHEKNKKVQPKTVWQQIKDTYKEIKDILINNRKAKSKKVFDVIKRGGYEELNVRTSQGRVSVIRNRKNGEIYTRTFNSTGKKQIQYEMGHGKNGIISWERYRDADSGFFNYLRKYDKIPIIGKRWEHGNHIPTSVENPITGEQTITKQAEDAFKEAGEIVKKIKGDQWTEMDEKTFNFDVEKERDKFRNPQDGHWEPEKYTDKEREFLESREQAFKDELDIAEEEWQGFKENNKGREKKIKNKINSLKEQLDDPNVPTAQKDKIRQKKVQYEERLESYQSQKKALRDRRKKARQDWNNRNTEGKINQELKQLSEELPEGVDVDKFYQQYEKLKNTDTSKMKPKEKYKYDNQLKRAEILKDKIEANSVKESGLNKLKKNTLKSRRSIENMSPKQLVKEVGVSGVISGLTAIGTYKDNRREGKSVLSSAVRAGADFVLSETLGPVAYMALNLVKEAPDMAVKGASALFKETRRLNSSSRLTTFGDASFQDSQQLATMRQSGMELAKMSQYRLEQTLMGNEAKYLHR